VAGVAFKDDINAHRVDFKYFKVKLGYRPILLDIWERTLSTSYGHSEMCFRKKIEGTEEAKHK